jgi:hypothetical protein
MGIGAVVDPTTDPPAPNDMSFGKIEAQELEPKLEFVISHP